MLFTYYYIAGAILSFAIGVYAPSYYYSILFFWIGMSLTLVAAAYVFERPDIFRKKKDGTIPLYIRWLFIPFLIGAQLYNAWARKNDSVPAIQKIDDNLFLACRLFPSDMIELEHNGVKSILDVTAEFDGLDWSAQGENFNYLNLPVLDHQSPTNEQIIHAINWLDVHTQKYGVVIHCALGRGRSVFLMTAYLLSKNPDWSITKALETIHGVRKTARLNRQQLKALKAAQSAGILTQRNRIALIANPISGGAKWLTNKDEIVQRLANKYSLSIYETRSDVTAKSLAEKAIKEGHNTVIACGGDGTVSEVASVLVNTDLQLGIIPLGTTNALSHVLHGTGTKVFPIPICCDVIIDAKVREIDTAQCNDELVLLIASLGLGEKMIAAADRTEKNIGGQLAYLKGLWGAVKQDETIEVDITLDDEPKFAVQTSSLVVANAAPFSTILALGKGEPDLADGLLDITWLPADTSVPEQLHNLSTLAKNGLSDAEPSPNIQFKQAKSVVIEAPSVLNYAVDGESRQAEKMSLSIQPKSLKVLT